MAENGERMDVCLVGEPTCPETMGDMIKIGRRGSMNAHFKVTGKQGHAAYPHRANNPLPAMMRLMDRLASYELDQGSDHFDPSTLAVVTVDTGNKATNVIPAQCRGAVNIRFNDHHSGASRSGPSARVTACGTRRQIKRKGGPSGTSARTFISSGGSIRRIGLGP
jgi:succinyl-diaminopimelate desuccinylase